MCGLIKIKQGTKTILVEVKNIIRFEGGKGNCCYVFLADGKSYKITGNIGEWMKDAEIIASDSFVLVHRSHLINFRKVTSYDRLEGIIMNNGENIPATSEGLDELEKQLAPDMDNENRHHSEDPEHLLERNIDRSITFQREDDDEEEEEIPKDEEE